MKTVQSIERAFAILEAVASRGRGLSEIAASVELPKSTVARILHTLEEVGAVSRAGGRFRVGVTLRELGTTGSSLPDLTRQARPYLAMLTRETAEDAGLSVANGRDSHCLVQEIADQTVKVADWTGARAPLHVVPSGLAMLAHWPQRRVARFLSGRLDAHTSKSVTDPKAIADRLDAIRGDGYCWVFGEFAEDVNSVAAPVFDEEGVVGAIHVHGPFHRFPQGDGEAVARRVAEVAGLLSRSLDA